MNRASPSTRRRFPFGGGAPLLAGAAGAGAWAVLRSDAMKPPLPVRTVAVLVEAADDPA
ncbi:hypothetical protein [Streptomyces sp. NRRL F-5727]|uniref:hypothetical protein n=1 Tax=Streptomyces sp. NRRL F-5727 TaxID=1463871 RepID=UPI000ABFD52A|nr:hypothetical protein [Streptomyces sp. NRRL F-5727]